MEFDLEYFVQEEIIIDHGPLHDFAARGLIFNVFKDKAFDSMWDVISFGETDLKTLRPLTAIASYYGSKVISSNTLLIIFKDWLVCIIYEYLISAIVISRNSWCCLVALEIEVSRTYTYCCFAYVWIVHFSLVLLFS